MNALVILLVAAALVAPTKLSTADQHVLTRALPYLPLLSAEVKRDWPDMPQPSTLAAQVEQESLWNPNAHLHTSREDGYGFAQLTVTANMNVLNEVKTLDPTLRNWQFADRFDPQMQLRALVLKDKQGWRYLTGTYDDREHLAMSFAGYNGGLGGVMSDRRVCRATQNCDQSKWYLNTALTSLKAKVVSSGYGQSFFQINRQYVVNIMSVRRSKYDRYFPVSP
jgi:membrane-bound lytic murein transglycosylase MltF